MSIIVLGLNAAIPQPDAYSFDPNRGASQIAHWSGTKEKILPLMNTLVAANIGFDCYSNSGAKWDLVARSSANLGGEQEAAINLWEVLPNKVERDLLDSPECASLSAADRKALAIYIKNGTEPSPALSGTAATVRDLLDIGVRARRSNQPTIRHTQTTSNAYTVKRAYSSVGSIFATASIGAPSALLMGLPNSGSGRALAGGFNFGWMKNPTQCRAAAFNKIEVIQEWEFGEWSVFQYGGLI